MKTKILFAMSMVISLLSCDMKKIETAQRTIDSLQVEIESSHQLTEQMAEIGTLIDSIDFSRKLLRTDMIEGTSYENYAARLSDIHTYVKRTERKLNELERTARADESAFKSAIKKLRHDLDARNHELAALTQQVDTYRNENKNLITTIDLQKAEIQDKLEQIKVKQEETARLEEQINQLLVKSKMDEGEAYYARAEAIEETANRTQFAPRKKKSSMKQALELYKLAEAFGKVEAQAKVDHLEKRLGKSFFL